MINTFWDDCYKTLPYHREPFNSSKMINQWRNNGFTQEHFTGEMCDMRDNLPSWTNEFFTIFEGKHFGVCFYRMTTCNILPYHRDTYSYYKKIFDIKDSSIINRAVIFLEDWKPGHIFEIEGKSISNWIAGQYVLWNNDALHMAANLSISPRYTVQITFCNERF